MTVYHTKVLILGSGPAGCTAAIYASRANLEPIIATGLQHGGQLTTCSEIENFPGFAEPVQSTWLMEQLQKQAEHFGATFLNDTIINIDLSKRPFVAIGDSKDTYYGDTVIIATGACARWLGIKSELKFRGFGISICATCDGFFFRKKNIAVVGGGNSAAQETIYLSKIANKVTLIHRRDSLRAEKIIQDRLFALSNVEIIWNSIIDEIIGSDNPPNVTAILLKNVKTDILSELPVDGLFIAIGHNPNSSLFKSQLELDNEGYIITKCGTTQTSVPGVFAAGDIQDKIYKQAITAAGTGCMSAQEANAFLS
ncbi:MAG: thioredoxin-disulfide reductase [Rhodospirillaceae bacterium]|jgi:thioredoxin reductase (NADPH)|nr:thioredoxin-disulfide reductase [Rhodospirillaceae bacterium]